KKHSVSFIVLRISLESRGTARYRSRFCCRILPALDYSSIRTPLRKRHAWRQSKLRRQVVLSSRAPKLDLTKQSRTDVPEFVLPESPRQQTTSGNSSKQFEGCFKIAPDVRSCPKRL